MTGHFHPSCVEMTTKYRPACSSSERRTEHSATDFGANSRLPAWPDISPRGDICPGNHHREHLSVPQIRVHTAWPDIFTPASESEVHKILSKHIRGNRHARTPASCTSHHLSSRRRQSSLPGQTAATWNWPSVGSTGPAKRSNEILHSGRSLAARKRKKIRRPMSFASTITRV